jgi:hypothetical protein
MLNELLIWGTLLFGLVALAIDKRRGIGALTLAYFLDLSLGHVPGVLDYLGPNMDTIEAQATKVGFDVTLIGMTAFIAGAIAARLLPQRATSVRANQQAASAEIFSRLGLRVLTIGISAYFVLLPVSAVVPSFTAVASSLGTLLMLGFWFQVYAAANANDRRKTLVLVAMIPLLPMATLSTGGFIGFGTVWALGITAFLFVTARRRIWFYLAAPFVIYLGLSLFVTYYAQRTAIRGVVWDQNSGMIDRLNRVSTLVTDFQLLDLSNETQLWALDERLNQNFLVGLGVMRHREGETELLYGASVPFWALIPRAIWPDKPAVGGGLNLVSQFTGSVFEEGTSVGVGQVLEFYANFAMPGVLIGFGVLGFILMRIDQRAMRGFAMRNSHVVVTTTLPGLALLQPLGNLLEVVVAVASAIIVSQLLVRSKLLALPSTRRPNAKMSKQAVRVMGR